MVSSLVFVLLWSLFLSVQGVIVPFYDSRIQYDQHWTLGRQQDTTNLSDASVCPTGTSPAKANGSGASFVFSFVGTSVSIRTSAGAGAAAYTVTRDQNHTVTVQPGLLADSSCTITFHSAQLPLGNHSIHVVREDADPSATLSVFSIDYDESATTTDQSQSNSSSDDSGALSIGVLIAIAVCTVVSVLALLGSLLWLCCIHQRKQEDEKPPLRLQAREKGLGILSSTPTFLKHDHTKRVKIHLRLASDELQSSRQQSTSRFSRFTLLRPPTLRGPRPPPPAPVRSGRMLQVQNYAASHTYTRSSE